MKPHRWIVWLGIGLILLWIFRDVFPGQLTYQPPGLPIEITVNANGEISLSTEGVTDLATPFGTFGFGVVFDPSEHFGTSTLTVRLDGVSETIYDLTGFQTGSILFEPGSYQTIALSWRRRDLLLELARCRIANCRATDVINSTELAIAQRAADFSCGPSAFRSGLNAVAVRGVNLRSSPEVPDDWDANWSGIALQAGERVAVIAEPKRADGFWLNVRRSSGEEGWVKECTPQDGLLIVPE